MFFCSLFQRMVANEILVSKSVDVFLGIALMAKKLEDEVRTVVVGGKNDIPQQHCGTATGQLSDLHYW